MKKFILFFLLIISWQLKAQNNAWIDLYSYNQIKDVFVDQTLLYGISENAFFTYEINEGQIDKFSSIQGLTGDEIAYSYYHSGLKKQFIIYTNALIQIIDEQKHITNIPDLFFNGLIPENKKICHSITSQGNMLYLAMDYGISEFDLEHNLFGDTYFIGDAGSQLSVRDVAVKDPYIYAATPEGLKKADKNTLLIDFNNWHTINPGNWLFIKNFKGKITGIRDKDLYIINTDNTLNPVANYSVYPVDFSISENYLLVTNKWHIYLYDEAFINTYNVGLPSQFQTHFTSATETNGYVFAGTTTAGVFKKELSSSANSLILPGGPSYNDPFGIDARNDQLWVVYGKHSPSFNPYPLMKRDVSHYNKGNWTNIPYEQLQARSLCYVKINPSNPDEVYISSGHDGVLKIVNDQVETRFDETNSTLDFFVSGSDKNIRVFGMNFDEKNNLYVTQTGSAQPIKVLYADGKWDELYFAPGFFNPNVYTEGIKALDIRNAYLWAGTMTKGVLGYKLEEEQYISIKNGIEPTDYTNITALDLDLENTLWIGNIRMFRYMPNPENIFNNPAESFRPVKIDYQGSIQLFLEGQSITKILTDGNNNKWIGTSGNGVYYVSEDAKKIIYHFTKENSPLPSNEIYDIAVDDSTGKVYFATLRGLVGYHSKAFAPEDELADVYAFPNPVIMQKHEEVTIKGLMRGVNVKIIDVEGNLVFEKKSQGGSLSWDLKVFGKYQASSGVYIVLITNDDGTKTQTTKILLIK